MKKMALQDKLVLVKTFGKSMQHFFLNKVHVLRAFGRGLITSRHSHSRVCICAQRVCGVQAGRGEHRSHNPEGEDRWQSRGEGIAVSRSMLPGDHTQILQAVAEPAGAELWRPPGRGAAGSRPKEKKAW